MYKNPRTRALISLKRSRLAKERFKKLDPEAKKARIRAIEKARVSKFSKMSKDERKQHYDKAKKTRQAFYNTYAGHLTKLYMQYSSKMVQKAISPERKAEIAKIKSKTFKETHKRMTPEQKATLYGAVRKKEKLERFEIDVPRKKTYCGVVTEKELEELES